jgi:hypothetical protein
MKETVGRVHYGARSFHQDATLAMKGDIVRALIETITNSDDAYNGNDGKIRIEVEHRHGPWTVITRDRATGMTPDGMKEAIEGLGGRTSGFELGRDVRGNLGRGAKDLAAFGNVDFESICDKGYARLVLDETGETRQQQRKATPDDRQRLSILRSNGTVVTMHVRDNVRCPRHSRLKDQLSCHYQLRDILSDKRREVVLVDANSGTADVLRYAYPDVPVVLAEKIKIPEYPNAYVDLTIFRHHERYDDPASNTGRPGGILIRGRRAIYENTYLSFENNLHAGWFSGIAECRYIDQLASEYDDRFLNRREQDAANNTPIITRSRDGLEHNHPFYRALAESIEVPLGKLVAAEEAKAQSSGAHETARTRRLLDELGRDLARLISEDLREIDEEELPPDDGPSIPSIKLIPELAIAYMGEDRTLTARVRADLGQSEVSVEADPEGVVELVDGPVLPLVPHRKRLDLLTAQIRVRPLLPDGQTLLTVSCGADTSVAIVETRPQPEVVEVPVVPPDDLQFQRDSYRLTWKKRKRISILAPVATIASEGTQLRVTSSEAGIVVYGGIETMQLDDELEYYIGQVEVEARTLGSKGTLRAELGSRVVTCSAVATKDDDGPNLRIEYADEDAGSSRAVVKTNEGRRVMRIMGRHPAISRYLGPGPDFPHQGRPLTKAIVAEILAAEATRMVMERKYPLGGSDDLDAAAMYAEHMRYMKRYLPRCHRALVPDPLDETR